MNQDRESPLNVKQLHTASRQPVSRLGLASQYLKDLRCVQAAFEVGINFYFSYDLSSDPLVYPLGRSW
jgi:hypothetical protein